MANIISLFHAKWSVFYFYVLTFQVIEINSYECHYCNYRVRNCTDSNTTIGIPVCDENGLIAQPDVFCTSSDCQCQNKDDCLILRIGCTQFAQRRSNSGARCISQSSLSYRFQQCSNGVKEPNIEGWQYFNKKEKCFSEDCIATRSFVQCNLITCGRMITAWKEDPWKYNFVVAGSNGDKPGSTLHYVAQWNPKKRKIDCKGVSVQVIKDCYTPQTQNNPHGKCQGTYMYHDQQLSTSTSVNFRSLDYSVWIIIIASGCSAIAMAILAGTFYMRNRAEASLDSNPLMKQESVTTPLNYDVIKLRQRSPLVQSPKSDHGML